LREKNFQIGHAKTLGPAGLAFEDDSSRKARDAVCRHKAGDRFFDSNAFVRRKAFFLRGEPQGAKESQKGKEDGAHRENGLFTQRMTGRHESPLGGVYRSDGRPGTPDRGNTRSKTVNTGPLKKR
jgi:hypothetical protein